MVTFDIDIPTDTDWPWMLQAHARTVWENLPAERRQGVSLQVLLERVAQQVGKLRGPDGPPYQAYVARDAQGNRAGFIWVEVTQSSFTGERLAIIIELFVTNSFRRQGVGQRLIARAEAWALAQGLPRISLNVSAHNSPAQALYTTAGYVVEHIRMNKELQ